MSCLIAAFHTGRSTRFVYCDRLPSPTGLGALSRANRLEIGRRKETPWLDVPIA
jgi:hypothetical protein